MTQPEGSKPRAQERLDLQRPNAARMYDYYLDGSHNFAADRALADRILARAPMVRSAARANRAFLQRAVRYCLTAGIRQFVDLGSGIPTVGHVHHIAQQVDPAARIAYVDNEPVAVIATEELIAGTANVSITEADLRDPQAVLTAPGVAELIDFARPVALLAISVLHFVPDSDDPAGILAGYRATLSPGSYLAFSHVTPDPDAVLNKHVTGLYQNATTPVSVRTPEQLAAMVPADMDIVAPGIVPVPDWHPDAEAGHDPSDRHIYAALARVPAA